jgi:chitodextrinase
MAPDNANNSYMLEVDGGSCYTVGDSVIPANTWTWVDYQSATTSTKITASLTAGQHSVKFFGRESSVKVDRVLAVTDTTCVPTGAGDNCAVAADATAPSVSVTAPADGAQVSGTVQVAATATDNKAVTKVEFYINNALQNTDTSAPYGFSWNTSNLPNGSYSVGAKAYDEAANVGADTNTVTVKNGDMQAPSTPGTPGVQAAAYNRVNLNWAASTDDVAVTGYTVSRNGTALATLGNVTTYSDTTTLPSTQYSYKIVARDAAGNVSAASGAATVTTPAAPDTQAPTVPANVKAVAAGTSQINLEWTASTDNIGVAAYDVFRGDGANPTKIASVTTTKFGDTGLKASTPYNYYVAARDANGNTSAKSAVATATTAATPPPNPAPTDPEETKTGVVRGKVRTGGNRAVADVRVTLYSGKKRYIATTNAEGVYRFENIPAGRYSIQFKASGYYLEEDSFRLRAQSEVINNARMWPKDQRTSWWQRWWYR